MRIRIRPYEPDGRDKPVYPRSRNAVRQDLIFLKVLAIALAIALLLAGAYEVKRMQVIHEKTGILKFVKEHYNRGRHSSSLVGLDLTIDGEIYYLDGSFIHDDGSKHAVTGILPMKNALMKSAYMNHPIAIQYIGGNDIIGAASGDEVWLDAGLSLVIWRNGLIQSAAIGALILAILVGLYLFRKHYRIEIQE